MNTAERDSRSREADLRALIARQRDVLTAAQALDLGFTRQSISRRSQSGEWQRVLPGTYVVGTRPPDFLQSAMAGLLWGGSSAVLSHFAAASLWKLVDRPDRVELWIPRARHLRTTELIVHRGSVGANDRRMLGGFPVTAPAKTVVDCASDLDEEALEAMVEDVLRRGLTTELGLRKRVGGHGRAGSGRLRALLDDRAGAPALESRLELRVWRLLRAASLRPVRQYVVRVEGKSYRLDFAWPTLKVAVEADGYSAHGLRRAFEQGHARLAALVAHGWLVVPVTWRRVTDNPHAVLEDVFGALRAAAA